MIPRREFKYIPKGLSPTVITVLVCLLLFLGGSALWVGYQSDWDLEELMDWVGLPTAQGPLFRADQGFTRQEARQVFEKAEAALASGRYVEAVSGFKSIEKAYPGLLDVILFHESEAYAKMPDELRVQQSLRQLVRKRPDSALAPQARYQLAQSHLRAKEYDLAERGFRAVLKRAPQSDYALGSYYYLGVLTRLKAEEGFEARTLDYWRRYMDASPDGRFSYDIAKQMEELLQQPSAEDHRLMGLGYANGDRHWAQAVKHLNKAPFKDVWLPLGRAQLKNRQIQPGLATLVKGIPLAKDKQTLQEGVDMLVRNSNKSKAIQRLRTISQQKLPEEGGDYVLWKLARLNPSQSKTYYRQLVKRFPKGDYAPESSWQLLWPMIRSGQHDAFLKQSETHLERYPYARSAAQALFWRGKLLEKKGQVNDAVWAYQEVVSKYPVSYYAFRSSGRLIALNGSGDDPGWRVDENRAYPPPEKRQQVSLMEELKGLRSTEPDVSEQRFWAALTELEALGSVSDIARLTQARFGETPAIVESWQVHQAGDRARGIRIIRDDLYRRAREGNLQGFNPTPNEMKLLYPLYFTEHIQREAPSNDLDPFLVQSLMREESYFNELAVSSSNALGLMQLLPSTAREVSRWVGMRSFRQVSLFQPSVNVKLGSRYLGHLHGIFKGDSMLSVGAYNGGPNAMKRWVRSSSVFAQDRDMFVEMIPYAQTRNYIKKVYGSYWNYSRLYPDS